MTGARAQGEPQRSAPRYEFHIEAETLGAAINALARQADQNILFPYELAEETGLNPVDGRYTIEEALEIMLRGTKLSGGLSDKGVIFIALSGSEKNDHREAEMNTGKLKTTLLAGAAAFLYGTGAYGADVALIEDQDEAICADGDRDCEREKADEIVVTGTNIRGLPKEYLASPTFTYTQEDIAQSGFSSLSTYIQTIPQNFRGEFGEVYPVGDPSVNSGLNTGLALASPSLRGLGADATLTLLNGRRLSSAGPTEAPTVSFIPSALIERIEILADGASATYGADAVGGVMNFITRRDFEGLEVGGRYGTATEIAHSDYQLDATAGTSWSGGNIYGAVALQERERLFGDRVSNAAGGNAVENTLIPEELLLGVFAGISQEAGPLTFSLDASYFNRDILTGSNQYNAQGVGLQFIENDTHSEGYAIYSGIDWMISDSASLEVRLDYSENDVTRSQTATTGNIVSNFEAVYKSTLLVSEARLQSVLFDMPAGTVSAVVGGQYRRETVSDSFGTIFANPAEEKVWSAFAETFVPLISDEQNVPLVRSLTLSLAGRYENFGDLTGDAFAPKFGMRWDVNDVLSFRGTYSESFLAPKLRNTRGQGGSNAVFFPVSLLAPLDPDADAPVLTLSGDSPNLVPQDAKTFTVGFDVEAQPFTFGLGYYNVEISNRVATPSLIQALNVPGYDIGVTRDLADGQALALLQDLDSSAPFQTIQAIFLDELTGGTIVNYNSIAELPGALLDAVAVIGDGRPRNFAVERTSGLDFNANVSLPLFDGELSAGVTGQYIMKLERQESEALEPLTYVDVIYTPADLTMNGNVSWRRGPITIASQINYTDDYLDNRVGQEEGVKVDSYTFASLSLGWDNQEGDGVDWLGDTSFNLTVSNITNAQPPQIEQLGRSFVLFDPLNAALNPRRISISVRHRW